MPVPTPTPDSRRRILLRALLVLFVFLAALLSSLPALISTNWGVRRVVGLVNARGPYTLSVRSWRVQWFRPAVVEGVGVVDAQGVTVLRADKIRASRSLIDLLRSPDLGEFTVESPAVVIPVPAPAAHPEPGGKAPRPKGPGRPVAGTASAGTATASAGGWPRQKARVVVTGASLSLRGADGVVTNLLANLDASFQLNPTNALARWDSRAALPLTGGELKAEGLLTGDRFDGSWPASLAMETALSVHQLPAGPALDLLSAFLPVPRGQGVWNLDLSAGGSPSGGMRWTGAITGTGVSFREGPLGADELKLGDLSLLTRGELAGGAVLAAEFHLTNALARVDLSVTRPGSTAQAASLDANLNLAALARQLPGLFDLKRGVSMDNGILELGARTENLPGGVTNLNVRARLDNVSGSLQGTALTFDQPFVAEARVRVAPSGWRLDAFNATTPLGTLVADGDPSDAKAVLSITLERALREAGKFFDTGSWEPSGDVQVILHQTVGTNGVRAVKLDARSPAFSLSKSGALVIGSEPATLLFSAGLAAGDDTLRDPSLHIQLPFLRAALQAALFRLPGQPGDLPELEGMRASGRVELAGLSQALFHGDLLAAPLPFSAGHVEIASLKLDLHDGDVLVPALDARLRELALPGPPPAAPLPEVALSGQVELNPAHRTFSVTNGVVQAAGVALKLEELQCADWLKLPGSLIVHGAVNTDFPALRSLSEPFAPWPADLKLGGAVAIEAGLREGLAAASVVVRDFEYRRGAGLDYRDPQMRLDAWVNLPDETGRVMLRNARLITGAATIGGRGVVSPGVELEGELAYDLARVTQLLQDLGVREVALTGRESSPWSLRIPAGAGADRAVFQASLAADQVSGYGLKFEKITLPLSYSNQVVRLELDAGFEGGRVHLAPLVRLDQKEASLRFAPGPPFLENVKLTPELADRLLARIHPVFKGSSLLEGRLTFTLKDFLMPLAPDWDSRTSFTGTIHLADARLGSSGLVKDMLDLAKIREQQLELGDRDIPFACQDGRVSSQPLVARIKGTPLTFSGTVGLDSTLHYQASTPITESLAREWGLGSDVAKYVIGQNLTLPIHGTVTRPALDRDALRDQLRDLAKAAGHKAIEDKAEDLLRDLFDKKKKDGK